MPCGTTEINSRQNFQTTKRKRTSRIRTGRNVQS